MYSYGKILASYRKKKGLTQQMLANEMTNRGYPTKSPVISAWEKETNAMNICQFFMLCDILDITEINTTFHVADQDNPFSKLTDEGVKKAYEYIDLLLRSGLYEKTPARILPLPRRLQVFEQAASAGSGQFLDSDRYDLVEVGPEVPDSATFGVRLSGDSMEPAFENHSIVWVHQQDTLANGEIGVFYFNGQAYCKRFVQYADSVKLFSENIKYQPIDIPEGSDFKVFGKVVGHTAPK